MRRFRLAPIFALLMAIGLGMPALAQEPPIGASVDSLINYAKTRNPEYAAMQAEAEASGERVTPAGALPDPKFRTELRDITRFGEQNATLSPSRVGSTRYLLMQDIPWFGKRDLKRDIASLDAQGAQGKAQSAWSEVAAKIKVTQAQRQALQANRTVVVEILALMVQLEKIAQARYAGGLAAQQDVIRAQVEQTNMRSELLNIDSELRQANARLNALLARPPSAPLADAAGGRPWPGCGAAPRAWRSSP